MCVLMPETATFEEIILILNPLYNDYKDSAELLLERMKFRILENKFTTLSKDLCKNIYKEKLNEEIHDERLVNLLSDTKVHCWHLSKISAEREVR